MQIHHLALRTADVPRLAAFYRDVIGLAEATRPAVGAAGVVWLSTGAALLMIEPRSADEPGVPEGSMELIAFAIPATARAVAQNRLVAAGVAIEGQTAFTLYFRDPDGRRVGLSHFPDRAQPRA